MGWTALKVEWTSKARKEFRNLDSVARRRVDAAIQHFAGTGEGDIKKVQGTTDEFRMRVGGYRVAFKIDWNRLVMTILHVGTRGDFY
ncbi:MAG: type II toxin-antitoxin system RelE/ParE family toxin [Polyangiaceae bacterium]